VATAGVSTFMVLNFGIEKIELFLPTLLDQYKTGPGDVSLTMRAIISIGIPKATIRINANEASKTHLVIGTDV
jgi:hypothetical protein